MVKRGGDLLIEGINLIPAADGVEQLQIVVQATKPIVIAGKPIEAGTSVALSTGLVITDGPKVLAIIRRDQAQGKSALDTVWDVLTSTGGDGVQMAAGLFPLVPGFGLKLTEVLGFGSDVGAMNDFLQGIRDGTVDDTMLTAKAHALGLSPALLRQIAGDPDLANTLLATSTPKLQGWYAQYQALYEKGDPALIGSDGQVVSFQEYVRQQIGNPLQRLAQFKDSNERAIAEYLEGKGMVVIKNPMEGIPGVGRQGDAYVDSILTEFKTLAPGASPSTIKNVVNNSIRHGGQARDIIIDARGSGLSEELALLGVKKALGISRGMLDHIMVIGDNFLIDEVPPEN